MNYFDIIRVADCDKIAIIEDGIPYTYGELKELVISMGDKLKSKTSQTVYIIYEDTIMKQLVKFLACNAIGIIPVIVPEDAAKLCHFDIKNIPKQVCMAAMTSGSRGIPKILYRTYESWADFFPIQNKVFGMDKDSILFAQGSLAFTGNLNLYMAQFYLGGTIVAENKFNPRRWAYIIEKENVNAIYMIPTKLMLLSQVVNGVNTNIKLILSGSQSLGKSDAQGLKKLFPKAEIILYYGASELNYVTYIKDSDMTDARNLVGKPFPNVSVFIKEGEIYVDTKYHAEGITCPYSLSDRGYLDSEGRLYFEGRSDDIVLIRGRKVSLVRIENELESFDEIEEAAVILNGEKLIALVTIKNVLYSRDKNAYLDNINEDVKVTNDLRKSIYNKLRKKLAHFEMPCKILFIEKMPHNDSGKKDKRRLLKEVEF